MDIMQTDYYLRMGGEHEWNKVVVHFVNSKSFEIPYPKDWIFMPVRELANECVIMVIISGFHIAIVIL